MEEQIIARLALNAFRENDSNALLKLCSEHVSLLTRVLSSGSQDRLEHFLWSVKFEFVIEVPKKAPLEAIQTTFDINSTLFVLPTPIYLSPDPETNLCLLETNIKLNLDENGEGAVAVLLIKEIEHWKFHNAIVIKVGLPLEYYTKLGWRDKFESENDYNFIQNPKEGSTDQLSLDDYWGSEGSSSDFIETEVMATGKTNNNVTPQRMDISEASKPETLVSHFYSSALKVNSPSSNGTDPHSHIYNIIKGTYGLAKAQGVND